MKKNAYRVLRGVDAWTAVWYGEEWVKVKKVEEGGWGAKVEDGDQSKRKGG